MAIAEVTVAQTVLELSRFMGDLIVTGTATAGDANTITDTVNLTQATNDDLKGYWVGVYEGVAIGDDRNILASSASADSLDADSAWSATPNTSSKYIVTRHWRAQQYLDAIASGIRRVQKVHLVPLDDVDGNIHELITTNDILSTDGNGNGQMELWANGAAAAPDGWTIAGTGAAVARVSTTNDVRRGKYASQLTSDGTNLAQLNQDIKHFERYQGKTVTLRAWVKTTVATRTLLRITDGVSPSTVAGTAAAGVWEELSLEFTLSADPTQLQIDIETTAGSAVVSQWDDVRLISDGVIIYSYDLPTRLAYLLDVREALGSGSAGNTAEDAYGPILGRRSYFIERGANPTLNFANGYYLPARNRKLRLSGQAYPASITNTTPATAWAETVEVNPEYVKAYARWYLLSSLTPEEFTDQWRLAIREARSDYLAAEKDLGSRPMAGAVAVQAL